MDETGICSIDKKTCKAGNFCPATAENSVSCMPCSDKIPFGQGCYCKDNTLEPYCQECKDGNCVKCVARTFLFVDECRTCSYGCSECTNGRTCQKCLENNILDTVKNKCILICQNDKECQDIHEGYCDNETNRCVACKRNGNLCSSNNECFSCDTNILITTILGTCTAKCANMENNNYCKDGVPTPCVSGLTSECKCGYSVNCSLCTRNQNKCYSCLPNWELNSQGNCTICAKGYQKIGLLCLGNGSNSYNKIGGGTIAGIVIAIFVVVGAISDGLAFYFIKKSKTNGMTE
uniref:Cysteine-rich membrane protein 2 n=1 Tax=Spironucleus salmonicida TaxID=348837 RepID=V6LIY3_9EUKA|eukprot:EST44527.1 Cysteine-rich membrane protein 2 [Spironucleus salmonicida]